MSGRRGEQCRSEARAAASRGRCSRSCRIGEARLLALASIDVVAARETRVALASLGWIALGAISLAVIGSIWLARTLTRPIDRLSRAMASMARRPRQRAARRAAEPRARPAGRDLQRAHGGTRGRRSRGGSDLSRRRARAHRVARRARPLHRRPLRARQHAVGRDRRADGSRRRRHRSPPPRRAAARRRQDRRARRSAAEARPSHARGIRRDQDAPNGRCAHSAQHPIPRAGTSRSSSCTTNVRTATAIHTGSKATRFRWPRASSTSPMRSTR